MHLCLHGKGDREMHVWLTWIPWCSCLGLLMYVSIILPPGRSHRVSGIYWLQRQETGCMFQFTYMQRHHPSSRERNFFFHFRLCRMKRFGTSHIFCHTTRFRKDRGERPLTIILLTHILHEYPSHSTPLNHVRVIYSYVNVMR